MKTSPVLVALTLSDRPERELREMARALGVPIPKLKRELVARLAQKCRDDMQAAELKIVVGC